jgi:hypothetical protein
MKRDKRKRGGRARGLLGPAGHALGFGCRSGAARAGGRLGWAWSGRPKLFFFFVSCFFYNVYILASNELKPVSKFF